MTAALLQTLVRHPILWMTQELSMPVNEIGPCELVATETETAGLKAGVRSEVSSVAVALLPSGPSRKISVGMLLVGVSLLWAPVMPNPACVVPVPYHCDPKRAASAEEVLFLVPAGFGLASSARPS